MILRRFYFYTMVLALLSTGSAAQVVINEGSNRNYTSIPDENGDYPDWIELYNAGGTAVDLLNYSITDDIADPAKWVFPSVILQPGEYKPVFCSGKDRKPVAGFVNVVNTGTFTPIVGWNLHHFTTPFYWDGISNILINTCSYSSTGYTSNSVFKQTETTFWSTSFNFADGSPSSCSATYGTRVHQRPNMKLNGHTIGTGTLQNSPVDYPAPYGNWYWGARHQMLILAAELAASGVTAGYITNLAFNVVSTDPNTVYDYIDVYMRLVSYSEVPSTFEVVDTNNYLHTNFKISSTGETVSLYSPAQVVESQLYVACGDLDNSTGSHPDASSDVFLFQTATPASTNNNSETFSEYLLPPIISAPSGFYEEPFNVTILNPNLEPSSVHYTLDGSEPTMSSPFYNGTSIAISDSVALKARAFAGGMLPSPVVVSTYLLGVSHTTPVLSVVTDYNNLYGPTGIFDNWWFDWEKNAYVEYFDSAQNLIFSQRAGIQIDGGWGGARANPQHSFRVELDDGVLGDGPVDYQLIPDKPNRARYSRFYLRNGSNQYLVYPYKDACQVRIMGSGTNNYYSAWRPVSVYINGNYFGLYELREKFDAQYFETLEGADPLQTDILTLSAWYNLVLRAVEGSVDPFYEDLAAFALLDPADTSFWDSADQHFDLTWYTDYIIGESWMGNTDWPWNNIKIYRSDKSGFRWRFCLIDQELAMLPNGWTDCYFDHIQYMMTFDPANPYISIWQKSMLNERFRNYFVNRFADVMNTAYKLDRISPVEFNMYYQTVPEMAKEYGRWGDPNMIPAQLMAFHNNHYVFQFQISQRTEQVRNHILSNFGLPNLVDVTLNVFPPGSGTVTISTVTPDEYPWQGIYFNGVPVKIEAVPADGYLFTHWGNNGLIPDTLTAVFNDTLKALTLNFDAYFREWAVPVTERDETGTFSVYPNPANTLLYVRNDGDPAANLHYKVMDLKERVLMGGPLPAGKRETAIDISSIPPGLYVLQVSGPNSFFKNRKFTKL
jgi:hypothetical protein